METNFKSSLKGYLNIFYLFSRTSFTSPFSCWRRRISFTRKLFALPFHDKESSGDKSDRRKGRRLTFHSWRWSARSPPGIFGLLKISFKPFRYLTGVFRYPFLSLGHSAIDSLEFKTRSDFWFQQKSIGCERRYRWVDHKPSPWIQLPSSLLFFAKRLKSIEVKAPREANSIDTPMRTRQMFRFEQTQKSIINPQSTKSTRIKELIL